MKVIMKMKNMFNGIRKDRVNVHYTSDHHEENYNFEVTRGFDTTSQKKSVGYESGKWIYDDKIWKYYF